MHTATWSRTISCWRSVSVSATNSLKMSSIALAVVFGLLVYVGLNFLRFEPHDETMWKFWIFTQVLITTVPGLVMEKRGTRKGYNLALHIVLVRVIYRRLPKED